MSNYPASHYPASCFPASVTIEGLETALPSRRVKSAELAAKYGYKEGAIFKASGVAERYIATDESATDIGFDALSKAMQSAHCSIDDIDCVLAASGTMEQAIPYNGANLLSRFSPSRPVQAFDVNMTCLSFLKAFELAGVMLQSGLHRRIAIVSSEVATVGIDGSNLETAGLFGDGAAAMILSRNQSESSDIIHTQFETYGEGIDYCQIQGGGSLNHPSKIAGDYSPYGLFQMKGHELFRTTNKYIEGFIDRFFQPFDFQINDIEWIVPHQASGLALAHMKKKFKLDQDKVIDIIAHYGNQISVSLPNALHTLIHSNRIAKGDRILLIGTSAGLSIGAMLLQW